MALGYDPYSSLLALANQQNSLARGLGQYDPRTDTYMQDREYMKRMEKDKAEARAMAMKAQSAQQTASNPTLLLLGDEE